MTQQVDDFLAHFGIRGMHWGVRRDQTGSNSMTREEIKNHNAISDRYAKAIKTATNEAHVEDTLDRAHVNGHMEGNIKVSNINVSPNGKKIQYEINVYRLTPGKPNEHAGNGIKVEHLIKEVDRLKPEQGRSHADDLEFEDGIQHSEESEESMAVVKTEAFLAHVGVTALNPITEESIAVEDDLADTLEVDNFLAHFGIRGMHWGVRRSDAQLAKLDKAQAKVAAKQEKINKKAAKLGISKGADENSVEVAGKTRLSADAERFLRTREKAGHEMSDREIKEALQRAENIRKYNELFNPDQSQALKAQVDHLRLQKDYAQLKAEMNPSKIARVNRFLQGTGNMSVKTYRLLDKSMDGEMTKGVKKTWDAMRGKSTAQKVVTAPLRVVTSPSSSTAKGGFRVVPTPGFTKPKKSRSNPVYKVTTL